MPIYGGSGSVRFSGVPRRGSVVRFPTRLADLAEGFNGETDSGSAGNRRGGESEQGRTAAGVAQAVAAERGGAGPTRTAPDSADTAEDGQQPDAPGVDSGRDSGQVDQADPADPILLRDSDVTLMKGLRAMPMLPVHQGEARLYRDRIEVGDPGGEIFRFPLKEANRRQHIQTAEI